MTDERREITELRALLDEQVKRLWDDNTPRLMRLHEYEARCQTRGDVEGARRYAAEYADLYGWCQKTALALYKPLIDLGHLTPTTQVLASSPNPPEVVQDAG